MKVKLNEKASIFHDAHLGITLKKGETLELRGAQVNAPSIKKALNGGFLIRVAEDPAPKKSLSESFKEMVSSGVSVEKLKKTFNLSQLKEIAQGEGIELEEGDTKDSILEALLDDGETEEESEEETQE